MIFLTFYRRVLSVYWRPRSSFGGRAWLFGVTCPSAAVQNCIFGGRKVFVGEGIAPKQQCTVGDNKVTLKCRKFGARNALQPHHCKMPDLKGTALLAAPFPEQEFELRMPLTQQPLVITSILKYTINSTISCTCPHF